MKATDSLIYLFTFMLIYELVPIQRSYNHEGKVNGVVAVIDQDFSAVTSFQKPPASNSLVNDNRYDLMSTKVPKVVQRRRGRPTLPSPKPNGPVRSARRHTPPPGQPNNPSQPPSPRAPTHH
ncbi:OLC1v1026500C1 [Oldenlandia corymbosa var. corymbosa]|uniref:OLC1v1026500C1 n=1 Tax=Oldenlandia corymbosa var. corymbosa TaxID=529605 RepID=A0AAV1C7Y8_OLDCO|nr:OLC1v1026500C1 [Oldenlandia corymbosa var. corymbosa]